MKNRILEDLEDMMPVDCPRCGDIWHLDDMHTSSMSSNLICPDCYREEMIETERDNLIETILSDMEEGYLGKREGKKQLKELGYKFPKP